VAFNPVEGRHNPYGLTECEWTIIAAMTSQRNDLDVCRQLHISYETFLSNRRDLMRKFGARNELHLAHLIATLPTHPQEADLVVLEDVPSAWTY
jgi:DNA-binding CsgD family transcriptional regulator